MINTINIEIPSITENIRMIESFIDNAKEKFKLVDEIYGNIMIAVTEAVINAIKHGNKNDSSKHVDLTLQFEDSLLRVIVKDEGDGFDFTNLPDPTAPENIENPGGRGIFLISHLSDEVEFKDQGRLIEMVFYIEN